MEPRRARLRQNHRLVDRWNQNLKELCIASISRDPDRIAAQRRVAAYHLRRLRP